MDIQTLTHRLQQQLHEKGEISYEDVKAWQEIYPYFTLPLLLYIQHSKSNDKEAIAKATAYCGDSKLLATLTNIADNYNIYPVECLHQAEDTDSAIELFLDTYGKNEIFDKDLEYKIPQITTQDNPPTDNVPQDTIALQDTPTYDYMSIVAAMPDVDDSILLQDNELVDKFLEADAAGEQLFSKPSPAVANNKTVNSVPYKEENEPLFTESLAKIYIQQRRYAKALEIIRKLNLNNPEKNIYFADQIRFLEKLIINIKN